MVGRVKAGVTFWDRVNEKTVRTERGCLEFRGCTDEHGYGRINKDGKLIRIHRASWIEQRGHIPDGLFVCHVCDNPPCWNVEHLFLGTHADNMADMKAKKRNPGRKGDAHPYAKLSSSDVAEIRKIHGVYNEDIGRLYGVCKSLIGAIKRGEVWH